MWALKNVVAHIRCLLDGADHHDLFAGLADLDEPSPLEHAPAFDEDRSEGDLGGRGDTNDGDDRDDQASNSVIYGKIGGSEDVVTTGYASDGWYYSKPFDINFTGAQLQEIGRASCRERVL